MRSFFPDSHADLDHLRSLKKLMSSLGVKVQAMVSMGSEPKCWIMSLRPSTQRSSKVTQTVWKETLLFSER